MTPDVPAWLYWVVPLVAVWIGVGIVWIRRASRDATDERGLPPLVVGLGRTTAPPPARPAPIARPAPPPTSGRFERTTQLDGTAPAPAPAPDPNDATLQFLPGRLEIVRGPRRPDLRFIKGPGPVSEVTIGRGAGLEPRHIQLLAPTVSRVHARLRFQDGRWSVANVSETNPAVVNGRDLAHGDEHPLREGDRLELGECLLVFHER